MKREKIHLFIIVTLATLVAFPTMASANDNQDEGNQPSADEDQTSSMLIEPLHHFTSKTFGAVDKQKNVVLSPLSIHKALSMVLLGADTTTVTECELIQVLGLKGLSGDQIKACHEEYSSIIAKFKKINEESKQFYKSQEANKTDDKPHFQHRGHHDHKPPLVDLFNMVITKEGGDPLPAYTDKVTKYYDSSLEKVDDAKPETKTKLLEKLNAWGKGAGFGEPIMKPGELEEKFAAILLSAIHIQGFWFDDFHEYEEEKAFYNHGLSDKLVAGKCLTMSDLGNTKYLEFTTAERAKYKTLHEKLSDSKSASVFNSLSHLDMHVVEVPLQGDLSFTIFEPLHPSGNGGELAKLAEQLFQSSNKTSESGSSRNNTETKGTHANKLNQVLSLLDTKLAANAVAHLQIPKFNFENEINLKSALQSVGLNKVFSRTSAEISGMTTNKVYVDKITHQAMIDVNKFGVKAAGVTKIKMSFLSAIAYRAPIDVKVRNPFIFMIRYKKLPLFIGQLVKLSA